MSHRVWALLALLPLLFGLGAAAADAPRFALVVGNAALGAPTVKVHQSVNAVAEALRAAGYDVEARTDLDAATLRRAVREFAARVEAARGEAYAVLYLGGRLVQTDGRNFILPSGDDAATPSAIADRAVPVGEFLGALAAAPAKARLIVLDAAPGRDIDGIAPGLAPVDPPRGTFVALVTGRENGAAAEEDFGAFSEAFAKALEKGNPEVEAVFEETAGLLAKATGNRQKIARAGALTEPFPLAAPQQQTAAAKPDPAAKAESPASPERAAKAEAPPAPPAAPAAKVEAPPAPPAAPAVKQVRRVDLPPPQSAQPEAVPEVSPDKPGGRSATPATPEPPARPPVPPRETAAVSQPQDAPTPLPPRRPPPPPRVAAVDPGAAGEPPGFEPSPVPGAEAPPPAARAARPARPGVDEAYLSRLRPRDAYNAVIAQGTPEAYRAFLRVYPNHRLAGTIRARLQGGSEMQAWRRAESIGTPEAYIAYLQRFPYGARSYEAAERLAQMGIAVYGGPPMARGVPPGARYLPPGYPGGYPPYVQPF